MAVGFFPTNEVVQRGITNYNATNQLSQANLNDNATREAVAQIQARKQIAAQQMDQQRLAQQQAFQQQQLAQQGFFGRSDADFRNRELAARERIATSQNAAMEAWRNAQLQPKLDEAAAIKVNQDRENAMLATQAENIAKVRNEHERLTADLAKLSAMETVQTEQNKLPTAPTTADIATLRKGYTVLGHNPFSEGFKPQATTAVGKVIGGVDLAGARKRMQSRLDELTQYLKGSGDLNSLLTKGPDGAWMSTFSPAMGAPTNVFQNAVPPAPVIATTNTSTGFFPVPTAEPPRGNTGGVGGSLEYSNAPVRVRAANGSIYSVPAANVQRVLQSDPGAQVLE